MILLTIQEGKLITVRSKNLWETYRFISLQKKYIAGEMSVIVKAEDRNNMFKYEMHFPASLTSIVYQDLKDCSSR